jgi:1-acyl-sn-glycerol-3-phosphate acyltransferase
MSRVVPVAAASTASRFPMSTPPMSAPTIDRPLVPGWLPRLCAWLLRRAGWRVVLALPVPERCVAIFYPHTSNWDTVIGLAAKFMIGLRIRFVGKDTLFATPVLGPLLVRWGGVPVNRREPAGFVRQMAHAFEENAQFRLAIAPEGTRSRTEYWKSGFYRLARATRVPLVLAYIDYPRREIGVGACLELTGRVDQDMARIRAFYAGKQGRHVDKQGPVRLREEATTRA